MVITKTVALSSKGETDIIDITSEAKRILAATKLKNGVVTIFVPGSTGGLTTIEYEPGAVSDLKKAFERVAPRGANYEHNKRWGDGNGFSHVRASVLGPSINIPFSGGSFMLGTWQQLIFVDFDNKPRSRELIMQFVGEK